MKPKNLKTKIFLDSGNPDETKHAIEVLGFLDGQTTNPTLISKHPLAQEKLKRNERFSADEALGLYRTVVTQIAKIIPDGAISVEVYADETSTASDLLSQANEFFSWIERPFIKFPITHSGLEAAQQTVLNGNRVNMTLCFSQEQAAAVYAATLGASQGQVLLSPFVGRLDDIGYSGMDLVQHIIALFKQSDHHVSVLASSIRSIEHLIWSIEVGADCITAPLQILEGWAKSGYPVSSSTRSISSQLQSIPFLSLDLTQEWTMFEIHHELTKMGLSKFVKDWQSLIQY